MFTAFVTGASGLVGTHLLYELLLSGYRVKALIRRQSNAMQVQNIFTRIAGTEKGSSLFQKIEWRECELLDFTSMSQAIDGCTHVFHAAAIVSFRSDDYPEMMRVNVDGTTNIVNVCIEKKITLCHVSSIAALGRSSEIDGLITENDYWQTSRGRSAYSFSKYKAEMEVWRGIAEGLQAVIVNPAVILGTGDLSKGSSKFFSQVQKGLQFYTTGVTGFVDVRDVSRCMIALVEQQHYGERFIISADNLSYHELFNLIAIHLNVKPPKFAAKPWMLAIAWRIALLLSKINGKKPFITKETANSAFQKIRYSSEKIEKTLDYQFTPLNVCIERCCRLNSLKS